MTDRNISKLKVADLKNELRIRGLKVSGIKSALAERLQSAINININEPKINYKQISKKRKLNHDHRRHNAEVEVEAQTLGILEMPIEILEFIFDYLDLKGLSAIGATCKWLHQIASSCYQQNYSGLTTFLDNEQDAHIRRFGYGGKIDIDIFIPFIDKIEIELQQQEANQKFIEQQSKYRQLKKLIIYTDLTNIEVDSMKEALSKIEYLELGSVRMFNCSLENLLALTPNIKRLCVLAGDNGNTWLDHSYPMLEHCEIDSEDVLPIANFLTLNPNINKFGINLKNLWENRYLIEAAGIKLDDLSICIGCWDRGYIEDSQFNALWQLLNQYREKGIYKRFHIFVDNHYRIFNQSLVDGMSTLATLNSIRFCLTARFDYVALSSLAHLEYLHFIDSTYITDIEILPGKLEHLKQIHFCKSNVSHVKLFVGGSSTLESIQIEWFMDESGTIDYKKILNLAAINKERAKLVNAKTITFYVEEPVYLDTKRANRHIYLDFIKLKRTDTLNKLEFGFGYPVIMSPNYVNCMK